MGKCKSLHPVYRFLGGDELIAELERLQMGDANAVTSLSPFLETKLS